MLSAAVTSMNTNVERGGPAVMCWPCHISHTIVSKLTSMRQDTWSLASPLSAGILGSTGLSREFMVVFWETVGVHFTPKTKCEMA